MSNISSKPVVAIDYTGKLALVGVATHHDPALCHLIHLPSGEFRYYPVEQCRAVTSAQALEVAIASGEYDNVPVERLRVAFGAIDIGAVLKGLNEEQAT